MGNTTMVRCVDRKDGVCKRVRIVADEAIFDNVVQSSDFDYLLNNNDLRWVDIDYSTWKNKTQSLRTNDLIVLTRPWWVIVEEGHGLDSEGVTTTIQRVGDKSEAMLRNIASIQYPRDCTKTPLYIRTIYGYSEYGNKAYDTANQALHSYKNGAVFVFQVRQSPYAHVSFLDEHFCDDIANKWNCGFMASTNCSLPTLCYTNIDARQDDAKNCTTLTEEYDSSKSDANLLSLDYVNREFRQLPNPLQKFHLYHFAGRSINFSSVIKSQGSHLFHYTNILPMVIQRLNYKFRLLVDKEIHMARKLTSPHFGKHLDCVAIHVRHFDRALPNVTAEKYFEWCAKFQNLPDGTCKDMYNVTRDCIFHYIGIGCDLIPFGAIRLEDYLHAADFIFPGNRNVVLMTDDGDWIEKEKKQFPNWNIFAIHGTNYHSKASTANGINFFASLEAMTQCSAFVGHERSAIYNLVLQWMCSYRGPRNNRIYGECPAVFDFGNIDKS